jgi:ankyrin repeat protein
VESPEQPSQRHETAVGSANASAVVTADSIEALRIQDGVRPLEQAENGQLILALPNGVYGFAPAWMINSNPAGVVGGTGIRNISLERRSLGTLVMELHKLRDGQIRVVGYLTREEVQRLAASSGQAEVTLYFSSVGEHSVATALSLSTLRSARSRRLEHQLYVTDLSIEVKGEQNEVAGTPRQNEGQGSGPSTAAPGVTGAGTTKAGATALTPVLGGIHEAAFRGDVERMQVLLKDNSDLVSSKDEHGWTALEWAAYAGQKDAAAYLLARKAEVSAKDNDGDTPLHRAAEQGHREVVELLLANQAEVDAKDNHGWTALHFAANYDRKEVAELLLAHGANVNVINETGNTPLDLAVTGNHRETAAVLRRSGGLQSLQEKFAPLEKIAILPIVDARTDEKGGKVNVDKLRKMAANVLKSKHYEAVETNHPQPGERWTMAIQLDSLSRVAATVSGFICDAQSATKSEECKGRGGVFWKSSATGQYAPVQSAGYPYPYNYGMQQAAADAMTNMTMVLFGMSKGEAEANALANLMSNIPAQPKKKKK